MFTRVRDNWAERECMSCSQSSYGSNRLTTQLLRHPGGPRKSGLSAGNFIGERIRRVLHRDTNRSRTNHSIRHSDWQYPTIR